MDTYDIAICGAGIIGCAAARALRAAAPHLSVCVLEKHHAAGMETSSRNSGVVHSGFHQHPKSFKAHFAREGSHRLVAYAHMHGIPVTQTGMLIAIPRSRHTVSLWRECENLWRMWRRGREHDISFHLLGPSGIGLHEPNITALAGIFIPDVWIIDQRELIRTIQRDAADNGALFLFAHEVVAIHKREVTYHITTSHARIAARAMVNAAGLHADDIATLALGHERYRIYPWRGEYYEVVNPDKRRLVRGLVYPAIPPRASGKGIHFSPRPDGRLFLGPNAKPAASKHSYTECPTSKSQFLAAVRPFLRLDEEDIAWAYAGIRPKLSATARDDDFLISVDSLKPLLINCVGIESPGLSASIAIADYITKRVITHM